MGMLTHEVTKAQLKRLKLLLLCDSSSESSKGD